MNAAMQAAKPIADIPVVWRCKCGGVSFAHHVSCCRCGEWKPASVQEKKP